MALESSHSKLLRIQRHTLIAMFCIKVGCHPNIRALILAKMQAHSRRVVMCSGRALLSVERRHRTKTHKEKREDLCVESSSEWTLEHKLHFQGGKLQTYPWAFSGCCEIKPNSPQLQIPSVGPRCSEVLLPRREVSNSRKHVTPKTDLP